MLRGQQPHGFTPGVGWGSSLSQQNQDLALVTRPTQPAHSCLCCCGCHCGSGLLFLCSSRKTPESPAGLEAGDAGSLTQVYLPPNFQASTADLSCNRESEILKKDNDPTMGTVLPPHSCFTCRNPRHVTSYSLVPRTHHLWDWPSAWAFQPFPFWRLTTTAYWGRWGLEAELEKHSTKSSLVL